MSRVLQAGLTCVIAAITSLSTCFASNDLVHTFKRAQSERSASGPSSASPLLDTPLFDTPLLNTPLFDTPAASRLSVPRYRVVSVVRKKPECQGERCPSFTFKRLTFEGHPRFNIFLEQSLLGVALMDTRALETPLSPSNLAEAFWKTAEDRDEIVLGAQVRRATPSVVVIELQSYLYSGGAHGISTMQYINWSPSLEKILTLNDLVLRGRMKAFEVALKKQYIKWLDSNEFAQTDQADYIKMWPFQFSDNAALMRDGIAVTFEHYVLGPYALGMPTILVPFSELKGIINSRLLAKLKV